jgi:hypothetical protein
MIRWLVSAPTAIQRTQPGESSKELTRQMRHSQIVLCESGFYSFD